MRGPGPAGDQLRGSGVRGCRRGPSLDSCRGPRRLLSDRGSATVWSVGAIAVLCVVFGVVLALGQAVVVRHRAAGGADLAALAAADHWAEGATAACARAGRVARAQGVRLVRCEVDGEISDVTAASGRGPFTAEVRARAGPPTSVTVTGPATVTGHATVTGTGPATATAIATSAAMPGEVPPAEVRPTAGPPAPPGLPAPPAPPSPPGRPPAAP